MPRPKGSSPPRCLWTKDDGTTCTRFKRKNSDFCTDHIGMGVTATERARRVREAEALAKAEERMMAQDSQEQGRGNVEGEALAAALRQRGLDNELERERAAKEQIREAAEALSRGRAPALDDPDRPRGEVVPPAGAFTMEGAATRAALELLALEEADKRRRQEIRRRSRGRKRNLPPATAHLFVPRETDLFTPRRDGGKGEPYHTPGWIPRWVRDKDPDGKPTPQRARNFEAWGGRPVKDEHGEPIVDIYGRYMEMPAARYGAKVISKSVQGAFDHDDYMQEQLYDLAEFGNQEAGRSIVSTYVGEEHGDRSY